MKQLEQCLIYSMIQMLAVLGGGGWDIVGSIFFFLQVMCTPGPHECE